MSKLELPTPETIGDNRLFTVTNIDNFDGLGYAYLTIELADIKIKTVVFYKYPDNQRAFISRLVYGGFFPIYRAQFKKGLLVIGGTETCDRGK